MTEHYQFKTLPNSPVATSRTDDIWFFDELTGWLVNSSGYVCKTDDGGQYWTPMYFLAPNLPSRPYLRSMAWANRQYGWFGTITTLGASTIQAPSQYLQTLLYHTKDGGETWDPVLNLPEGTAAGVCGCYAVNERVFYASGSNDPSLPGPTVIKTVNGGASWELMDMSKWADNLIDIYFFDENKGFVVGGKVQDSCPPDGPGYESHPQYAQLKPVVLRTLDGGKTWQNMAAGTEGLACGEWGWKIQFLNEQLGYISLENFAGAGILKTTDGGETWTRLPIADANGEIINNNLEGIGFIDENRGWVGGWGDNFTGLLNSYTEDGGQTWVRQDHVPCDSSSDDRVKINRYRFVGDPVNAAYCSGRQVYKLQPADEPKKKGAFAKQTAKPSNVCPDAAQQPNVAQAIAPADNRFDLQYKNLADGSVEISYELPEDTDNVFIGLWSRMAWHVKTLVDGIRQTKGRQRIVWDGKDEQGRQFNQGAFICRLCIDSQHGASETLVLSPR